jgi:tRNA A-37 threonylcarbamoyl transferase component Bud32
VSKLDVGTVFAGFRIEALLGRGGMGSVYRARDLTLDSERALKVLEPELTTDRAFRERFQREARLAAQLENQAVVPVYHAGEEDGRLYIAMRLIRGPDLHRLVAKDGPLEPQRTARIVGAVASALDAAHARGIVHRDVKPANILVELSEAGEHVFLTDFGISRSARPTEEVTSTGQLLGTADYISPEQIEGQRADARSDVYALGCVLCYLLTGEPPFRRETELATLYAHAHAARPRPSLLEPGLPAAIDEVVVRATAVDPDDRYPSAGELSQDLRRSLAMSSAEARPPAPSAEAAPTEAIRRRRPPIARLAAGALVVAAIAVAVVLLAGGGGDSGDGSAPEVATIGLGDAVDSIVVGNANVLAVSQRDSTLSAIDPATGKLSRDPESIPHPSAVAIGFGSVWVTSASRGELLRYAPGHRRKPIEIAVGAQPSDVAVDDRWVWVANREDGSVSQVDPETNRIRSTTDVGDSPEALATGEGITWVASPDTGTLTRLRADAPGRSPRMVELDGAPEDLVVFEGQLWVVDSANATLSERSLNDGAPVGGPLQLGHSPVAVAGGPEALWVADAVDGTATRVDPATRDRGAPVDVGKRPAAVAVGAGSIWVTNAGDGTVSQITP